MSGWGLGILLASRDARAADRWRRIEDRYVADILRALGRRLPITAERIMAERNEWIAAQYLEEKGPDK